MDSAGDAPIVRRSPVEDPAQIKDNESAKAESLQGSLAKLSMAENGDEVVIETEPVQKKKKGLKGLHLPVRAFKSREDRDPERVNEELKVGFENIINEPEGFYTPKVSWHLSHEVFGFGRACCYSITTFFCGIPFAFIWGIIFAFLAAVNVWIFAPCRRGHLINMSCLSGFWSVCISTIFDPFYKSFGLIFSNLRVRTEKFIV
ncbi:caveolin-3-like [Styela clava]|uniref:caveolin-3-like n=1 Tax=Styela clava TaxID=7725 RepID=UPI00193A4BC0|nr:caveolin-3-like [Styela clava]